MTVTEALKQRTSTREFLATGVSESLIRDILDVARWAPSGGNLQPWKVIVVSGSERDAVIAVAKSCATQAFSDSLDRPVYPPSLWEPYRTRRFKVGEEMYTLLGIPRSNRSARIARLAHNYEFFGAPVAMFFIIDDRMGHSQWAHMGMFMQSIALAALERGLNTCMQEAWAALRNTLKSHFALGPHEMIYCGMALGYADYSAAVNFFRSERESVECFANFRGFT